MLIHSRMEDFYRDFLTVKVTIKVPFGYQWA